LLQTQKPELFGSRGRFARIQLGVATAAALGVPIDRVIAGIKLILIPLFFETASLGVSSKLSGLAGSGPGPMSGSPTTPA
jgi:hypothetical protein